MKFASVVAVTAGAALMLCACGSKKSVVSVGGKNTTDQKILVEIIAGYLEKQLPGVTIERKSGMGNTMVVQGAMQSGAIDLYVENTGTALAAVLNEDVPEDESIALERVRSEYKRMFQLVVMKPLGYHQRFVAVASTASTSQVKAGTLTELGDSGTSIRLGSDHDFADRKDGVAALTTKYRISMRALPLVMPASELYEALKNGTIDLAGGYSTDAWVDQPDFRVLKDNLGLFPQQPACIIVRSQAFTAQPGLERALEMFSGKFTDESMLKMDQEVDLKHRTPLAVAQEFLKSAGL